MELKGIREALTRADQMEHGARPASPHRVCPSSLSPNFTLAAAITSLQRQQVRLEQQQHYHTPHLSLRSTGGIVSSADAAIHRSMGIVSSNVPVLTSGSSVDKPLSRNILEVEGGEEVQQCLIEMLQGRHPLRLQVRTSET